MNAQKLLIKIGLVFVCLPALACAAPAQPALVQAANYAGAQGMHGTLHWPHMPLRIFFDTVANGIDPQSAGDGVAFARAGFDQWVAATSHAISYVVVDRADGADMVVSFAPSEFLAAGVGAVGNTLMSFSGTAIHHADMILATRNATGIQRQSVAAHEFGHALGIDGHSDDPNDLMYPSSVRRFLNGVPVAEPVHAVTARDLATLQLGYRSRLGPPLQVASAGGGF